MILFVFINISCYDIFSKVGGFMIYPKFIKEHDTIGVVTPSDGIIKVEDLKKLDKACSNLIELNFAILEAPSVRKSTLGRSNTPFKRAQELEDMFKNNDVKTIICGTGGNFLVEILPYLDYKVIRDNPKWLQGYSDPTWLTYTITTNLDIATIYSNNFKAFSKENFPLAISNNLEILNGNLITQESFTKCETRNNNELSDVYYEIVTEEKEVFLEGRMLGGCLDVINEIFGTRFDKTKEFLERYKDDGIIWYLENCMLSMEDVYRILLKFKDNGYFKYVKGFIFGRSLEEESYFKVSFKETVLKVLKDLNVPIIINADIGHLAPRVTIINGAIGKIKVFCGKALFDFELK